MPDISMCRMLIAIGKVEPQLLFRDLITMAKDQTQLHELNELQGKGSWQHPDGWGVAYLQDSQWIIKKSILPIFADSALTECSDTRSKVIILHARRKIGSDIALHNTHPFHWANGKESFVFCHNGFIDEEILFDSKFQVQGETDSERLFYSLLSDRQHFSAFDAIKNLAKYQKYTGTNIILSSPTQSLVASKKSSFSRYYQMMVGEQPGVIIVSSERLPSFPGMNWQPLPFETQMVIDHLTLQWGLVPPPTEFTRAQTVDNLPAV